MPITASPLIFGNGLITLVILIKLQLKQKIVGVSLVPQPYLAVLNMRLVARIVIRGMIAEGDLKYSFMPQHTFHGQIDTLQFGKDLATNAGGPSAGKHLEKN